MEAKILIVDDHHIIRSGIRALLRARSEWEICAEAGDGKEAVRLAKELKPDAIIMDVTMPVMGGLGAAYEISRCNLSCRVLIFTVHDSATLAKLARQSGAKGMVVKSRAARDLIDALDRLLAGEEAFFNLDDELVAEKQRSY